MQHYNQALDILMKSPVTDDMIQFLTRKTLQVLPSNSTGNNSLPTPPGSPIDGETQQRLPSLRTFITRLVRYTNVYTPTLLTTVCYLNKLKRILPKDAKGLPSTIHRLFLACLILSAKYNNDSSPLNKHWAKYTDGLFSLEDINLMERQLLQLLNWELRVTKDDLILDLQYLIEPIREHVQRISIQKKKLTQLKRTQFYNVNANKLNDKQRNVSIASNLSSSTLVGSSMSLKSAMSSRSMSNGSNSSNNGSNSGSMDIWHDQTHRSISPLHNYQMLQHVGQAL